MYQLSTIELLDGQPARDPAELIPIDALRLEIKAADRMTVVDPNGILGAMVQGFDFGPVSESYPSALSGDPGYEYKSDFVRMNLTADELRRLVLLSLRPEEYFGLRRQFGEFYEIHDDFYDPGTGKAVQPKLSEEADSPSSSGPIM